MKKIKIHTGEWFPEDTLFQKNVKKVERIEYPFLYSCIDDNGNILFHVLKEENSETKRGV